MQIYKNDTWLNRLLKAILGIGILASFVNFFNFRSLWLDEALLSISIVGRDYSELLLPLESDQVAPIGFLYVENFISTLFRNADWSLRIFPFLCFLASIWLIYKLNKQLFKTEVISLLSAVLFCLNTFILYYSVEVKQYMSDVFICLLILVSALSYFQSNTKRNLIRFTSVCFLAIWFSNIAIILLFTVGFVGVIKVLIKKEVKRFEGFIPITASVISFAVYYIFFIYKHPAKDAMMTYWTDQYAFLYKDIFSWEFRYFIRTRLEAIIRVLLEISDYWLVTFVFILIGVIANIKRKTVLFLLVTPLVVHLALSYFKLYPFDRRLVLYALPLLITLLSYGLFASWQFVVNKGIKLPIYIILIPVLINLVTIINLVPFEKEEIKKGMTYVNENLTDGDEIYVYGASKTAFDFYKESYININKLNSIFYSKANRNNWLEHDEELRNVKKRVWMIFSHYRTINKNDLNEKDYILKIMKTNGYEISEEQKFTGSSVYKMEKP